MSPTARWVRRRTSPARPVETETTTHQSKAMAPNATTWTLARRSNSTAIRLPHGRSMNSEMLVSTNRPVLK